MDESLVMGLDSIKDTISICIFTMILIYIHIFTCSLYSFIYFCISYKLEMSRLMNYGLLSSFLGKHPMTPLRSRHHPPMLPFYERPPWGLLHQTYPLTRAFGKQSLPRLSCCKLRLLTYGHRISLVSGQNMPETTISVGDFVVRNEE